MLPKIAVIIVVYNGQEYLPDLLESLSRQSYPQEYIHLFAVDNNSKDSSGQILVEYSGIRIIKNRKNLGFAKANNQAIKEALEIGCDYIFLLNQDTVCQPDTIEKLVKVLDKDEEAGIVQPLLLLWPKKDKIQTSGNKLHFLGFGYSGDYKKQLTPHNLQPTRPTSGYPDLQPNEIAYASGAAMLVRRQVFEKIGLFDEIFFSYHEDLDFGWRARLAGFKILRVPQAQVWHKYQFSRTRQKFYLMERGRLIVLLKNYRLATLILIFPGWLFMEIGVFFYALLTGQILAKIKSYLYVLAHLGPIFLRRVSIQRKRLAGDRVIARYLTGRIEFEGFKNPILIYVINPFFALIWCILKKLIIW